MPKNTILILLILAATPICATELKPFTTDGCSVFPDGTVDDNSKWLKCCITHDYAYWKGGTRLEKEKADMQLKQCVSDLGESKLSLVMHLGVTFGGEAFFPTWYRWGYGWPYLRGYKKVDDSEKAQVKTRLLELRDLIDTFIEE